MSAIDQVRQELEACGFDVAVKDAPQGPVVVFDFRVPTGRYREKIFKMGVSFQDHTYPEYPPHFVHVANIEGTKLTKHSDYSDGTATWSVYSFPPSDFWDDLPSENKNMRTFVRRHLLRVWSQM